MRTKRKLNWLTFDGITDWNELNINELHAVHRNSFHFMICADGAIWRGLDLNAIINSKDEQIVVKLILASGPPLISQRMKRSVAQLKMSLEEEFQIAFQTIISDDLRSLDPELV